jgi:predicted TIM-barrel fold metal-dependent hydrolase
MIIDAHLHCTGTERTDNVLRELDHAGVDIGVLLAPFLTEPYSLDSRDSLRVANLNLSTLVRNHQDRLLGFAVVNPANPGASDDLEEAASYPGIRGLKMVPSGWYPYDDCALKVYERAEKLNLPILFHSGIFIDGKSGRFCRPSFYEAIRQFPKLRVTLAHLGWPWCDEANAVGLIDLINGVAPANCQFRFDISFGPPPIYRSHVLRTALSVLGPDLIQFGSDRFLPCPGSHIRAAIYEVEQLFDEMEVDTESRRKIMATTASTWLGIGEMPK